MRNTKIMVSYIHFTCPQVTINFVIVRFELNSILFYIKKKKKKKKKIYIYIYIYIYILG